jgi:predicted site-specific integrase-resolvase
MGYARTSTTGRRQDLSDAAEQPSEASLRQKALEWRHDTLLEHPDRLARVRTALIQNTFDEPGHRRHKVL